MNFLWVGKFQNVDIEKKIIFSKYTSLNISAQVKVKIDYLQSGRCYIFLEKYGYGQAILVYTRGYITLNSID